MKEYSEDAMKDSLCEDDMGVVLCQCCGKRPAAGYIQRYGIYTERFCARCYLSTNKSCGDYVGNGGLRILPKTGRS